MNMSLIVIAVLFLLLGVATARRGRRQWRNGAEDAALTAAGCSAGAMFIAIFTVLLGVLQ